MDNNLKQEYLTQHDFKTLPSNLKPYQDKHSKLGASSCERWWNCPGSPALIEQAPEQPESEYAKEGTFAHQYAAATLQYPNVLISGISEEIQEAVQIYVDYVNEIKSKYKLKPHHIKIEEHIAVSGHPDLYGTADCIITVPYNRLIVIDFKYGAGVSVPVTGNKQLLYYALGAWNGMDKSEQEGIERIELVIIQPRTPGGAVDSYFVHPDALAEFHKELLAAVNQIPSGYLCAGDWCKFCPAKTICPAFKEMITEGAGDDFKGLLLPKPVEPDHPTKLGPNRIAQILKVSDAIEKWLKDIESYARQLAEQGVEIPGYKLVEKYGNRKWIDEDAFAKRYRNDYGVDIIYQKPKVISPAQFEKYCKKALLCPDFSDLVEKPLNGKTLVPISDKRPDIQGEITDFNGAIND